MSVAISPMPGTFVGEVCGLDCATPLAEEDIAAIHAGMARYAVLVFPDQPLTDEQQLAFTRQFGELERFEKPDHNRNTQAEAPKPTAAVSNLTRDGAVMTQSDRMGLFKLGARLWHSDSSYRAVPAGYSLLSGRTIPSRRGETDVADMRAAYDALDDETKAEIDDLLCEHSVIYSRQAIGVFELTDEERKQFSPQRHPLVRVDPRTGRKSLFLSAHAGAIVGWSVPEARMLLRDLVEHATQPQFVYRHTWRIGDLLMYDNRTTMHRARRSPAHEARDVRRTSLSGDAAAGAPSRR